LTELRRLRLIPYEQFLAQPLLFGNMPDFAKLPKGEYIAGKGPGREWGPPLGEEDEE
jgi:hypothetical protein